jgi:glutaredoxin
MQIISKVLITSIVLLSAVGAVAATKGSRSNLVVQQPATTLLAAGKTGPAISTRSGASEISLAEHLKKSGATMYGAFWCPHCHSQKQLFGSTAWSKVSYIECGEGGQGVNIAACNQAGIKAFPTWRINGKNYPGTMSLFKLAKLSGYQGATKFQNRL